MAQAVSRRPPTAEARVRSRLSPCGGFVVDKVALGQVFPPEYFGFPLSVSFHWCSITRKRTQNNHRLHHRVAHKPQGCGASVASAAGPFTTRKKKRAWL
jgi:hypothetical protein